MTSAQHQTVQAVDGFAYGTVDADIHVFGNGVPLYVLQLWRPEPDPDPSWLLALPSRMLNSRYAVVEFTGREKELDDLRNWRDHGPRLSVQWLHAPGGQGKSRLAARFAEESAADGWTVATAARGPGVAHPPPGSQDLRTGPRAGVLLVVDYADRWPAAHLTWLLSNSFLHRPTDQARVLLLARSRDAWPAVRAALSNLHADTSTRTLPPLAEDGGLVGAGERHAMFLAARNAFAGLYGVSAHAVPAPGQLGGPDFGLTLAVHLAALAAVDRHAHAAPAPPVPDMTGLTAYLLDRERRHWRTLHEAGAVGATDAEISRAAFVAALTGALPYREAKDALESAGLGATADRLLGDHAYCYPPGAPDTVLEPLYPDRLTEDFLALSLPGHGLLDHPPDPWAAAVPELLLPAPEPEDETGDEGHGPPSYTPRALTFLTAASHRWPHLLPLLEKLDGRLPEETGADEQLAAAAAGLAERLAPTRLSAARDTAARARVHRVLGRRLDRAQRPGAAVPALSEAVRLYRELAGAREQAYAVDLAECSFMLAMALVFAELEPWAREPFEHHSADATRLEQAAAAFREAIEVYRRLAAENPGEHQGYLVAALTVAAFLVPRLGPSDLAVSAALEAVDLARELVSQEPGTWADQLAYVLAPSAVSLAAAHPEQAEALSAEAVRLARDAPGEGNEHLVFALCTRGSVLLRLGRAEAVLDVLSEAAELSEEYAGPGRTQDIWWDVVAQTIGFVWLQERATGTTTGRRMAVEVLSRLAHGDTAGRAPALLQLLFALLGMVDASAEPDEVLTVHRAIIHLLRVSDEIPYVGDDHTGRSDINGVLVHASVLLARTGRWEEAVAYLDETARATSMLGSRQPAASWASGLTMMAALLSGLGPETDVGSYRAMAHPQAVRVMERVADTCRRLAEDAPDPYEFGLAVATKVLAETLPHLGRHQEALQQGRASVDAWRGCVDRDPDVENRFQLALALRRHADRLTDTGEREEAAATAREAATRWRSLTGEQPEQHTAVAAALHLVALNLRHLRPAEALAASEEAMALVTRHPVEDATEQRARTTAVHRLLTEIRGALSEE
ncbi:hypothetical protein ACIQY8_22905 [Streptomyces albidoflavus]